MDATPLARAAIRRLAHDLANPLAALATAIDLAGDVDPLVTRALDLCRDRLELQRLLFGGTGPGFDRGNASRLLAAEAGRRNATLEGAFDAHPEREAQAAACLACLAIGLLNGPGVVRIERHGVFLEGPHDQPEGLDAALATGTTEAPALVPAAFAAALAGPIRRAATAEGTRLGWPSSAA